MYIISSSEHCRSRVAQRHNDMLTTTSTVHLKPNQINAGLGHSSSVFGSNVLGIVSKMRDFPLSRLETHQNRVGSRDTITTSWYRAYRCKVGVNNLFADLWRHAYRWRSRLSAVLIEKRFFATFRSFFQVPILNWCLSPASPRFD